ncbi:recombinase family protein [Sinanaerobacter chloroacetimidivorans]|uniref:Recombinase family protein n=1 Tax=Sinanaerobacter chloroacetimidivorans TaxID=2818044 RepID=A0A8J8B3H6_9FIRM|nr:recombinase family protein [Sinanaerobacter chloroacetimidivorans]MBR0599767.1 recombinase family protein [Sinanaerobacter chloroacetimidivorans]
MGEVQVLEATRTVPNGRGRARTESSGLKVERIRVAAYCRVSTDGDEQLGSFESQKLYYEEKIAANSEWASAGIFADEAITGTKVDKREGFQDMIQKCQYGEIDLVLTKSISRFARNTLDTLQYVRMLRDRNIAVFFEKENINTLDMNGEMLLTIMSSLAQQEVESLSMNVKMGLKMKMKRGEMIGFNGCLGYDYHPEDKSITVNEDEAEIVKFIFDMYLQGYGTTTIAKRLIELGKKNKKGKVSWHTHGVMGIIQNEKYKGDILLGKTFTTDPISKRRLANMGEEDQFYIRDHHEAIVSREVWDEAEQVRLKRSKNKVVETTGNRERYTRQYAFSSMCECAYCGHKLTRRTRHSSSVYEKPVWQCMNATKNGIACCPNCKAIDENILEGAFLEAFGLLAGNFDDVLDLVMTHVEEAASNDEDIRKKKQIDKDISSLESRKSRMTDMLIDGTITKDVFNDKLIEITRKLHNFAEKKLLLEESIGKQKDVGKRMSELRETLKQENILDEFDRVVLESIIDKVIVGGYDEEGNPDPYKLTFVLKGNQSKTIPNAKDNYKEQRNSEKGKKVS